MTSQIGIQAKQADNQVKKTNLKTTFLVGKGRIAIIAVGLIVGLMLTIAIHRLTRAEPSAVAKQSNPVTDARLAKTNEVTTPEEAAARAKAQEVAATAALAAGKPYIGDPIEYKANEVHDKVQLGANALAPGAAIKKDAEAYARLEAPKHANAAEIDKYNKDRTDALTKGLAQAQAQNQAQIQNPPANASAQVTQPAQKQYLMVYEDGTEAVMNQQEYQDYVNGIKTMTTSIRTTVTDSQITNVHKKLKVDTPSYKTITFKIPDRFTVPSKDAAKQGGIGSTDEKGGAKKGPILVRGGEAFYATLKLGVNTDDGSNEVLAEIKNGRLKGATILGAITRGPQNISFKFNQMFHPEMGKFSINAIAVTAEKMERAMADDIDRHWFQRYGSIAIASAMEGISQAAIINAQTGKVTQSGNGVWGTTVVERDPIDSTTEAKIAAGKVGAALGAEIRARNANVPDTFHSFPNKPLGIYFLDSVYESDSQ